MPGPEELAERCRVLLQEFKDQPRRKERFFPFYLVLAGKSDHPRWREALAVAHYYVENSWPFGERAYVLRRALKQVLEGKEPGKDFSSYWELAGKTPIPLTEYLDAWFDLVDSEDYVYEEAFKSYFAKKQRDAC